ncbi:MAG: efflux RND transporter permease subunit [Lautropia sp.]|nr:efflux RND transporter permease subunit [Lautropia sp.]
MNVSAWSIRNPIAVLMLFLLLTVAGLMAFHTMRVQNFPDMDLPVVTVSAGLAGASPGQLENDVARKIENSLANIQGLKHISTTLSRGSATIVAEFRLEKPVQEALDDVRSAVQSVRADLPTELPEPIVAKMDLAKVPVLAYSVQSERLDAEALSWFVDNELTRRLLALPGVGQISRVGGVTRQVHVDLQPHKLRALGLTVAEVSQQLRAAEVEAAGGEAKLSGGTQPVRLLSRSADGEALATVQLSTRDGRRVRLDQVAHIHDTVAEPTSSAWLDGKPTIGFEVTRSRGASEVEVGERVREAIRQLAAERPGLVFTEALDFVTFVDQEYRASMKLLYEGALLAVIVVWLFLRNWRATFIAAVALPMSVIPAFIGMYLWGFSLNGVTLLALSLVVGILVDDAIVEIENIVRHLRQGKTPYQAAMEATDEIGLAVVATTFTLIAVFLPTAFMSGVVGKFFKQFGWTASLAIFASLVVARMLTPMMAAYLLRPVVHAETEGRWMRAYLKGAGWVMRHRVQTMVYAVCFFVGSLALAAWLPAGFLPSDDNDQTQVKLTLAPGATLQQTEALTEAARQRLMGLPEVEQIYATVGGGASADPFAPASSGAQNRSTLTVRMKPRGQRPDKLEMEQRIRAALDDLPGARVSVGLDEGKKYIVALSGNEPLRLDEAARMVEQALRRLPGVGNVTSSADLVRPEIIVRPDPARAAALGVTPEAIANTLRMATQGDYEQSLPKLNLDERQVPIVVKLDPSVRQDLDALRRVVVQGAGGPVMLGQVATLELGGGPAVISRYDRERNVNLEVELGSRGLGDIAAAVQAMPVMQQLPDGVHVTEVGDAEVMVEMFTGFAMAMMAGILCIYIVLALLFKDLLHPVTILSALPLAIGGSFVGLLLGRFDLSMPALIGLVMLMGIVTKNSILLVEYAIMARRDHGMNRWEALLDACHKRARPIIMTTLAMGAGMLPIIIGSASADSTFRAPMGVAVLGGLLTSTALSLLVVPAVFTYVDDLGQWVLRRWRRSG